VLPRVNTSLTRAVAGRSRPAGYCIFPPAATYALEIDPSGDPSRERPEHPDMNGAGRILSQSDQLSTGFACIDLGPMLNLISIYWDAPNQPIGTTREGQGGPAAGAVFAGMKKSLCESTFRKPSLP